MMTFKSGTRGQVRPNLAPQSSTPPQKIAWFYKDNVIILGPESYIIWYS